jgi:CRP-like cAMP-binding protein
MKEGMGFGELSLVSDRIHERIAYVHTLKPTFFLVIEQTYFRQMKRHHEKREEKAMIDLLREIHMLKDQSHFIIKKFTEIVERQEKEVTRKQILYAEGAPASYVYIVVKGSFLITKRVTKNGTVH